MKNFLINFKKIIKFLVTIVASREFAFIYCLVGTLSQTAHTYYLLDGISSLTGWWKVIQTLLLAFFISSSLLYFTSISDSNDKSPAGKRVLNAVTLFMWLEIIINLYYYSKHIIIDTNNYDTKNLFQLAFGVLIACIIPVTIKLYSSQIRAKEWLNDDERNTDITSGIPFDEEAFKESINKQIENAIADMVTKSSENGDVVNVEHEKTITELIDLVEEKLNQLPDLGTNPKEYLEDIINQKALEINNQLDDKISKIDSTIKESFKTNSDLFLKQFERKLEMMSNK